MVAYVVEQIDTVTIDEGSPVSGMDLMSPYVWREQGGYRMLVRGVPDPLRPSDPTGLIAGGSSRDGLTFHLDEHLAIVSGAQASDPDSGGCEDPTVIVAPDGHYVVYYTGVDAARTQGCMMVASGPTLDQLVKRRVVLEAPPGEGNIKEATLWQTSTGDWRLFYEYAANEASRIGVASGPSPSGPWTVLPDMFTVRDDSWDNWHLSTGPIAQIGGGDPVMFYNGATHDARWRIGWISFDPGFTRVTERGLEPVLLPPPPKDREATDIAFAASTVIEGDRIALYYSLEDRILRRCLIRQYS